MMLGSQCSPCCDPSALACVGSPCFPWSKLCPVVPSSMSVSVYSEAVDDNPWVEPYDGQARIVRDEHNAVYVFDFADIPNVVALNTPGYREIDVSSSGVEAIWQVTHGCQFLDVAFRASISSPMTTPPNVYATDGLVARARLTIYCSGYVDFTIGSSWSGISYGNFGDFIQANESIAHRWESTANSLQQAECIDVKSGNYTTFCCSQGYWPAVYYGDVYDYPNIGFLASPAYLGPSRRVSKLMTVDAVVS
jgi:hypothetical protein